MVVTKRQYQKERRALIRECSMIEELGVTCRIYSGPKCERVPVEELFMFSLFALEFTRSEGL